MWDPENEGTVGKGVYWLQGDMVMPRNATYMPKQYNDHVDGWTNKEVNRQAPGVRDGIPMPTKFAQTQHRSSLFDREGRPNAFNWDQMADFVTGPTAQRQGQYWWDILNRPDYGKPMLDNSIKGTWNAPPTGFTAFRFITPASTRSLMTPL